MNNKDRRTFQLKLSILSIGCTLAAVALVFFLAFRSDTALAAGYERSAKSSSSARQTAGNLSEISGTLRLVWADRGGGGDHHAEAFVKDAFIIDSDRRVIAIEADNLDLLAAFAGREVVVRGYPADSSDASATPALRIDADSI